MSRYGNDEWTKVGTVFVDSGSIMVGDPCYTNGADASHGAKSWTDFLSKTWPKSFRPDGSIISHEGSDMSKPANAMGEKGIGIVVSSGYGDGEYPVFIKTNAEGRTMGIMVDFEDEE